VPLPAESVSSCWTLLWNRTVNNIRKTKYTDCPVEATDLWLQYSYSQTSKVNVHNYILSLITLVPDDGGRESLKNINFNSASMQLHTQDFTVFSCNFMNINCTFRFRKLYPKCTAINPRSLKVSNYVESFSITSILLEFCLGILHTTN
jgi:hypothetical protein